MTDIGTLNYFWSQTLVAGFVAAGVKHAVISPGARSTPLALAMLRQDRLICDVAVDERSAAFFALGMAKASRLPVLILATSGTAPANWLPAVIEASQSGIPLILLSADRPPELQGCGANQAIEQINLFGSHVRASHALGTPDPAFDPAYLQHLAARACEQATWPHPGPVHINQPFREPLLPSANVASAPPPGRICIHPPTQLPSPEAIKEIGEFISGRPGLIVCGQLDNSQEFASAVTLLAAKLNSPILAEPLSNLRYGKHSQAQICLRYNRWLADPAFIAEHPPAWILRFGAYPVTRHLQALLSTINAPHAVIDPWSRWSDPAQRLTHLLRADPASTCHALAALQIRSAPATWLADYKAIDRNTCDDPAAPHIPMLLDELPNNCPLFVGNSLAIRQLDSNSGSGEKHLFFYCNRGASGIEGNISSTAGIAAIHGRAVALLGDLTCQHDLGGLALLQGRDVVIVAVNNAGGGIFDYRPESTLPEFLTGWRTPQHINFQHAALTFGIRHALADNPETFRSAIRHAIAQGGAHLVELMVDHKQS